MEAGPRGKTGAKGEPGPRGKRGRSRPWGRVFGTYVVLAVTALALFTAFDARQSSDEAAVDTRTLRENLIETCQVSRTPLSNYFRAETESTKATDPGLFPDIPRAVFDDLIAMKIERLREVATVLDPAKCRAQYE